MTEELRDHPPPDRGRRAPPRPWPMTSGGAASPPPANSGRPSRSPRCSRSWCRSAASRRSRPPATARRVRRRTRTSMGARSRAVIPQAGRPGPVSPTTRSAAPPWRTSTAPPACRCLVDASDRHWPSFVRLPGFPEPQVIDLGANLSTGPWVAVRSLRPAARLPPAHGGHRRTPTGNRPSTRHFYRVVDLATGDADTLLDVPLRTGTPNAIAWTVDGDLVVDVLGLPHRGRRGAAGRSHGRSTPRPATAPSTALTGVPAPGGDISATYPLDAERHPRRPVPDRRRHRPRSRDSRPTSIPMGQPLTPIGWADDSAPRGAGRRSRRQLRRGSAPGALHLARSSGVGVDLPHPRCATCPAPRASASPSTSSPTSRAIRRGLTDDFGATTPIDNPLALDGHRAVTPHRPRRRGSDRLDPWACAGSGAASRRRADIGRGRAPGRASVGPRRGPSRPIVRVGSTARSVQARGSRPANATSRS